MPTQDKSKKDSGQAGREVPLDSASAGRDRQSLGDLEGRREQLSAEEEMIRRNKRSLLLRMKNRVRARR